jgi:putative methyltransferase (TIGR04325 family)
MLLKDYFPPAILRLARRLGRTYGSYGEALLACGRLSYQSDAVLDVVREKTKRLCDSLRDSPSLEVGTSDLHMLLAIRSAAAHGIARVIDFGGACGAHYFLARAFLRKAIKLHWRVVETERMASTARIFEQDELRFFAQLKTAEVELGAVDIVHSSTAIQYCADPCETLKGIVGCGARVLMLRRVLLTKGTRHLICVQRSKLSANGPGPLPPGMRDCPVSYPVTAIGKDVFESVLSEQYDIRAAVVEHKDAFCLGGHWVDMYGYVAEAR